MGAPPVKIGRTSPCATTGSDGNYRVANKIDRPDHFLTRRHKMNLTQRYKDWRSYRETVAALEHLSNRDLSDIGIGRSEIRAVARSRTR